MILTSPKCHASQPTAPSLSTLPLPWQVPSHKCHLNTAHLNWQLSHTPGLNPFYLTATSNSTRGSKGQLNMSLTEPLTFPQTYSSPSSHPGQQQLPSSRGSALTTPGVPGSSETQHLCSPSPTFCRGLGLGSIVWGWGWDHQGVRWRCCSPEPGLVPGKAQDAVAVGSVEVVLVRDALSQHLRVHHAPARLRATPEQRLQGQDKGGGSQGRPAWLLRLVGHPTWPTCVSTTEALLGPSGLLMGMV